MISELPESEIGDFDFEDWINMKLPGRLYSIREAVEFEEWQWRELRQEIARVPTRVRFSPHEDINLFGLPYSGELERAFEQKRQEAVEREQAIQARAAAEAQEQVSSLRARAIRVLGNQAERWLSTPNDSLGMRSPLEVVAGTNGYDTAAQALIRRREEIEAEDRARVTKEDSVTKLYTMA